MLRHLAPTEIVRFTVPAVEVSAYVHATEDVHDLCPELWSVVLAPEQNIISLTWGVAFPLGKRPASVQAVVFKASFETES